LQLVESGLDVVVTGGGGWLGLATLEMLESSYGDQLTTRVHAFASRRRVLRLRSGTSLQAHPLSDLSELSVGPHLLAHYAFTTGELVPKFGVADYVARNAEISRFVADHVRMAQPDGLLVLSSGAVYLGDDLATNPYGVLKKRDEHLFFDLAAGGYLGSIPRVVIPRLFNLAGPFLNKPDHYVLGSIVRDIARGGPIELRATQRVIRSYIHVSDLIDLAFAILLGDGIAPSGAFDTAGEREIEVGQLAALAASVLGVPSMPIHRPPVDSGRTDRYVGDPNEIRSLCHAYDVELRGLERQIEDTAAYMGL
jgi:UDP-glucuronate decarboxylase